MGHIIVAIHLRNREILEARVQTNASYCAADLVDLVGSTTEQMMAVSGRGKNGIGLQIMFFVLLSIYFWIMCIFIYHGLYYMFQNIIYGR